MFTWFRQPGAVDPSPIDDGDPDYSFLDHRDLAPIINLGETPMGGGALPAPECIGPLVDGTTGYILPENLGAYGDCISNSLDDSLGLGDDATCVSKLLDGVPAASIGGISGLAASCSNP